MPDSILTRQRAYQAARDTGLFAVGRQEAEAMLRQFTRRNGKPQAHTLLPPLELLRGSPLVQGHVTRHGVLPSVTRSKSKMVGRIRRAEWLFSEHGELVFLRLSLPDLDGLPLRSEATRQRARELVAARLKGYAPGLGAHDVAVQRGKHGGTHAHVLLPLAALAPLLRRAAAKAPAGCGGGVEPFAGVHVVRVGDSPEDRAAVAVYMGKDPDGRFGLEDPSHPDYLAALEDLLAYRARGERVQLSWVHGFPQGRG
jgi:hypothetical protein